MLRKTRLFKTNFGWSYGWCVQMGPVAYYFKSWQDAVDYFDKPKNETVKYFTLPTFTVA